MVARSGSSASRRNFLKEAALVSAAMAGGITFPASAFAALPAVGQPKTLNLGFAPDADAAGAVLVPTEWGTYATFRAMASDDDGVSYPIGTAVIHLVGCVAKTFSYSTNLGDDGRPYSFFDLKSGAIYEIIDSTWLLKVEEDTFGRTARKKKFKLLRHYVFTFRDTTFQCIAEGLNPKVSTDSVGDILDDLGV